MSCVCIVPWPFPSHAIASLKIARTLRSAGHDVVYINIGKDDARYAAHGFRSILILEDLLPRGLLQVFIDYSGRRLQREIRMGLPPLLEALDRELDRIIGELRPTLAVIDLVIPYVALFFHRAHVPSALLFTLLPFDRELDNPPLTSLLPLPTTPLARLRTRLHWWVVLALERQTARRLGLHGMYRQLAERCGFPVDRLRYVEAGCQPQVAELIACPACFDLPRLPKPQRFYLGPCIDFDRIEPSFDWDRIDDAKALAYCALGTRASAYPSAVRFFARVITAFASLPDWQVVIAAGDLNDAILEHPGATWPANVIAVADAPQLALLRRARLMITHGGLGSIKESLYFGVPLVVFPGAGDQFGNAARVAHHGLGAVGSLNRSSPAAIRAMVRSVGESDAIRARVNAMRAMFAHAEHGPGILEAVERTIAAGVPR